VDRTVGASRLSAAGRNICEDCARSSVRLRGNFQPVEVRTSPGEAMAVNSERRSRSIYTFIMTLRG
jgi:hypothetical protein